MGCNRVGIESVKFELTRMQSSSFLDVSKSTRKIVELCELNSIKVELIENLINNYTRLDLKSIQVRLDK